MFNNLKNKVREKTGTDLPKLTASSVMFGKTRSNQHSRQNSQGSIASITSVTSEQGTRDEGAMNSIHNSTKIAGTPNSHMSEEEPLKIIDWESKLNEKEREWREKEKMYVADLIKQTKELQEALSATEESRKKLVHCQEEKEQLEQYQKQEVSKIKELLLAKEEENSSNVGALKDALASVDALKQEVARLSPLEQQVNNCQTNKNDDTDQLRELQTKVELLSKENEALHQSNEESRRILDESLSSETSKNKELNAEIARLNEYTQTLTTALEAEKKIKDETLLRNAEISQMVQLANQELKHQQSQNEELFKKVTSLEEQLSQQERQTSEENVVDEKLEDRIKELENEINDKTKTIRILQQNLNDTKKTFQTELKNNLQVNKQTNNTNKNCSEVRTEDDINNKYMKHVLIKFLTSSEYEAQQLTKAVATLLKLNSEEERLIKETLEWRTSWFGSKPRVKPLHNSS